MKKLVFMVAAASIAATYGDIVFDRENDFGGASSPKNCRIQVGDTLKVTNLEWDSCINFSRLSIDPESVTGVEYKYRAKGTGDKGGQLYYFWHGVPASDRRKWILPTPIADGEWHTIKLDLHKIVDLGSWLGGGAIAGLRLDPTDAAGGEIEYEYLAFITTESNAARSAIAPYHQTEETAVARARRARQTTKPWAGKLDAPEWPDLEPKYYDAENDPANSMRGSYFAGKFISASQDTISNKSPKFYLRKKFTPAKKVASAWLQGMGDKKVSFKLNGRQVMYSEYYYQAGPHNNSCCEFVKEALKSGENTLEVEYSNSRILEYGVMRSYPGGAIFELFIKYEDGSYEKIDSDDTCESSDNQKDWAPCIVSADAPPAAPHPNRLVYRDFAHPATCLDGGPECEDVLAGGTVMVRYHFKGAKPVDQFSARVSIRHNDSEHWRDELELDKENVVSLADGTWRLDIPFEVPLYISDGEYDIDFSSNSIFLQGGMMGGKLRISHAEKPKTLVAEMKQLAGHPAIFVNDQPLPLLWGGVARFKRADMKPRHSDMPLTAVTVYSQYTTWHPSHGITDFANFDLVAEQYRRENPDAYFIWDLTVYPPFDFAKRHPEEMASDDKGSIESVGRFSYSYASKKAIDEMKAMVKAAIEYVENSPYADRVIGYRVNSGVTIEWLGWDAKPGRAKDFSEVNKRAYAAFAKQYYPELKNPHVPDLAERQDLDSPTDLLWDRKKHLNAIAYMEYNSWQIAKDVLEMAGCAKDTLKAMGREKLVGTYYGYTFYLNANGRSCRRGHFALKYLLDNNNGRVNFIMSPQSYGQRNFGDTCGDMKPYTTMEAHGILPVNEDDTRTHNRYKPDWFGFYQSITPWQTKQLFARAAGIALCHQTSPYFYSLASGVDANSPECAEVGERILEALKVSQQQEVGRHAEVALVASEYANCAMPDTSKLKSAHRTGYWVQSYGSDGKVIRGEQGLNAFVGEVFMNGHTRFYRAGTPVDFLLAEDLTDHLGDYKVYVFLNQFTYDDKLLAAVKKLQQRGSTILWLYAPGYLKDNTVEAMRELTGMRFKLVEGNMIAGVKMKEDGRWMGEVKGDIAKFFVPVDADEVLGTYANGQPGLAMKKVGNSTTYFYGGWQLDLPFVKKLVKNCFAYTKSGDPIEANDNFFTLHARFAGVKTVKLPRKVRYVYDVYNDKPIATDTDTFKFSAPLHSSWLFYYGDQPFEENK